MLNHPQKLKFDASDKGQIHEVARTNNIKTPKTFANLEETNITQELIESMKGFPVILKGYPSGRGDDVYLCTSLDEIKLRFRELKQKGLKVLLQEYIKASHGQDTRVTLVGNKVQFSMQRKNNNGDFKSNIATGGTGTLIETNEAQQQLAQRIHAVFGYDFVGIDLLTDEDGEFQLCELNSAPGWNKTINIAPALVKKAIELIKQ